MKILIVDDQSVNRLMLRFQLEEVGHQCLEAEDGLEAIQLFENEPVELVLMDIVMPKVDGYEAAKRIKEVSEGRHIPIIFLTAKTEEYALIQCLSHGDDYLTKPINPVLLSAKINAHMRTQNLNLQIQSSNEELRRLHSTLQQEHEMGQHVLKHALKRNWNDCPIVRAHLSPMSTFNGDLFLVAKNPKGGVYIFLGDMTGHGLSASIGAVPVSQVFFSMCAKGRPVREIAQEMNRNLKSFLPQNMFCAATIIQLNAAADVAKMWAGGLPPALVIGPDNSIKQRLKSNYLPLGILDAQAFNPLTETLQFTAGDRLLMMTDGVHDVQNIDGAFYGEEGLDSVIKRSDESFYDALLTDIESFAQGAEQTDDLSLVEVKMEPLPSHSANEGDTYQALPWELDFSFDAQALKSDTQVLPHVFGMLPHGADFVATRYRVETVVTELFTNALEHGLLDLESSMKRTADGFAEYYRVREARLSALENGSIRLSISYRPEQKGQELFIELHDSGKGFDWATIADSNSDMSVNADSPWGRGLDIVASLGSHLRFTERGACVQVLLGIE